jgi:hypothetical protein
MSANDLHLQDLFLRPQHLSDPDPRPIYQSVHLPTRTWPRTLGTAHKAPWLQLQHDNLLNIRHQRNRDFDSNFITNIGDLGGKMGFEEMEGARKRLVEDLE